jgi:competence protein ComEC
MIAPHPMIKKISFTLSLVLQALLALPVFSQPTPRRNLEIHHVDVEGGAATLIVTPAGESILVDTGWPGFEGRDAARIQAAMNRAGVSAIDHLIITHYHTDHYGGVPNLASRVEIRNFYDHGPMSELADDREFATRYAAYRAAAKNKTTTLRPGDEIKLRRAAGSPPISLRVFAAHGEVYPMSNRKANPACTAATLKENDPSDNARSIVFVLRYGDFDFFDGGDLTWNIENKLACPADLIGQVDLYQVTHHGASSSNNTALLQTLKPTVAIMNNGPRKGGSPETVKALQALPSLKALYQVHRNVTSSAEANAPPDFIANLEEKDDAGHPITVVVDAAKRSFSVTNGRTGASQSYAIK